MEKLALVFDCGATNVRVVAYATDIFKEAVEGKALGLKNLGDHTKRASSFLVMAIVGGAVCPFFMGLIADHYSMQTGFIVPLLCFVFIVFYGWKGKPKMIGS